MVSTNMSCFFPGLASPSNSNFGVPQGSAIFRIKCLTARDSRVAQPLGPCTVLDVELPGLSFLSRAHPSKPKCNTMDTPNAVLSSESQADVKIAVNSWNLCRTCLLDITTDREIKDNCDIEEHVLRSLLRLSSVHNFWSLLSRLETPETTAVAFRYT